MPGIIINPGSGPVANSNLKDAINNMKHYLVDCGLTDVEFVHLEKEDEDGRYHFLLYDEDNKRCHSVDMPGIPLDKVRYMQEEGQNIWNFPRLYLDGSSWVWCFGMLDPKDFEPCPNE